MDSKTVRHYDEKAQELAVRHDLVGTHPPQGVESTLPTLPKIDGAVVPEEMGPHVDYLPDAAVDDATDKALRTLMCTCFTKPQDAVFKGRRYFRDPYPHRWVIRDGRGMIVAHVGVHEKQVEVEGRVYRVGGVAEVCVHPDCRGRGYVRLMLGHVHDWLAGHGFVFAVLFGDTSVYGSSGYVQVANLSIGGVEAGWEQTAGMIKELSKTPWPSGKVLMAGPEF